MDTGTNTLLERLDREIRKVETNLAKLKNAREVVASLEDTEPALAEAKPKKLVDAVRQAVGVLGEATPIQVIDWLRKNWNEDVKATSVRSTLSGYKDLHFLRSDKGWSLKEGIKRGDPALL